MQQNHVFVYVLGIEFRVSRVLSARSTTELLPAPSFSVAIQELIKQWHLFFNLQTDTRLFGELHRIKLLYQEAVKQTQAASVPLASPILMPSSAQHCLPLGSASASRRLPPEPLAHHSILRS